MYVAAIAAASLVSKSADRLSRTSWATVFASLSWASNVAGSTNKSANIANPFHYCFSMGLRNSQSLLMSQSSLCSQGRSSPSPTTCRRFFGPTPGMWPEKRLLHHLCQRPNPRKRLGNPTIFRNSVEIDSRRRFPGRDINTTAKPASLDRPVYKALLRSLRFSPVSRRNFPEWRRPPTCDLPATRPDPKNVRCRHPLPRTRPFPPVETFWRRVSACRRHYDGGIVLQAAGRTGWVTRVPRSRSSRARRP